MFNSGLERSIVCATVIEIMVRPSGSGIGLGLVVAEANSINNLYSSITQQTETGRQTKVQLTNTKSYKTKAGNYKMSDNQL